MPEKSAVSLSKAWPMPSAISGSRRLTWVCASNLGSDSATVTLRSAAMTLVRKLALSCDSTAANCPLSGTMTVSESAGLE